MARRNHKAANRKSGARYPGGKLKPPSTAERQEWQRKIEEAEMQTVLEQPHRQGNRDQLCESPLGRFFLDNPMIRRELREAGVEFASLKHRWRAAMKIPTDIHGGEGSGIGPSDDTFTRWGNRISLVESSIKHRCPRALAPFVQITVEEKPVRGDQNIQVMFALHAAAIALGLLDDRDQPWGR